MANPPAIAFKFDSSIMVNVIGDKRAVGIEPTSIAWKAIVLPLNYARRKR